MITQEEVHVLDANAEANGVPTSTLMENAGKGVAEAIRKNIELKGKSVLILCGSGNNGGDGFVAARYLRKHCKVKIFLVKDPRTELSRSNLRRVRSLLLGKPMTVDKLRPLLKTSDIIIDSLLGVGVKGELYSPYTTLVNKINKTKAWVVSVDIPTGFGTRRSVVPDITVTFHDRKEGMTKENCGKIVVVDIGIPPEAEMFTGPGEPLLIPRPDSDIHKGQRGNLLVVGGGPYYGAPALSGMAAQLCGIDLVHMFVPERIATAVASHTMNFILTPLEGDRITEEHVDTISKKFRRYHAMVLGPGIGKNSDEAVLGLIKECPMPIIVDADALKALDGHENYLKGKEVVLTPHSGEFRHLTTERPRADIEDRVEQVKYMARQYYSTILLKGHIDVISDGKRTKRNRTGNEAMSTGGTGDVLAGIVGAMLAKGLSTFDAARVAAYVNGRAGDIARSTLGHSLTATDVLNSIPTVFGQLIPWWKK